MLVVHSVRGTVVRLGTNRGKQRDILLDPGHCGHLHPLRGLVTNITNLRQTGSVATEGRVGHNSPQQ